MKAFNAVPVFLVASVGRSIDWYRDALGWEEGFRWPEASDGPNYGSVRFGDAVIHLSRCDDSAKRLSSRAYIFLRGVDAYAKDLAARGTKIEGPETWKHGMREVALRDPDGNHLCFGEGADS